MADLGKVVCTWSGWPGAPASTVLYLDVPTNVLLDNVRNLFNGIVSMIPAGVTVTVPGTGFMIDEGTGVASGTWTATAPAAIVGTGTGAFYSGAGACITWRTASLNHHGHLIKGRSFMVPLVLSTFMSDGTLDDTKRGTIQTNANGYISAGGAHVKVWARPTTPGGSDGMSATMTSATVNDRGASLRSRR